MEIFHLGKRVGFIKYSEEFSQKVFISPRTYLHFFRIHNGFGFSVGVLQQLRKRGVRVLIILYETREGIDKLVTFMDYLEQNGFRYQDKCDSQIILPITQFNQHMLEVAV